jgi:type VI protein secretion system component VasK
VSKAFKPVHTVTPPATCADQFVGPSNGDYITKLSDLQLSLDELGRQPGATADAAVGVSHQKAQSALSSTRQLSLSFGREDAEGTVQKLLEAPITYADSLLGRLGPQELNGKGKGFCAEMQRAVGSKFPFNPKSSLPAKLEDVNAIFRPQQGALWVFYDQNLKKLLPKAGNDYAPDPSGSVTINPRFVRFFRNAAAFSDALYQAGGTEPRLSYSLKPTLSADIQNVRLTIDGQSTEYTEQNATVKTFTWPGTGEGVRLNVKVGGADTPLSSPGLWGVFGFFWNADKITETSNGGTYEYILKVSFGKQSQVMVSQNGQPIVLRFDLNTGASPNVFRRGYFSQLGCVAEIAQ